MSAVIVVTGASRGYGKAIVDQILKGSPSTTVLGTARNQKALEELQKQYHPRFEFVAGDIRDESTWNNIVEKALSVWGRIDGVVHNAGVLEPVGKVADIPLSEIKKAVDVNLFSVIGLTQKLLPTLRKSPNPRIIAISSGAASKAYYGWSSYCMAKIALNMFVMSLVEEEPEIFSVALRPGVLDTDMQKVIRDKGGSAMKPEMYQRFVALHKDGKLTDPEVSAIVVAKLILSSDRSLNGQFVNWEDSSLQNL
ncbi:hypothetical protein BKA69DRAFT_1069658 [Paraphysoderma sedebokerense]|nr:hypothetical protein BKA69DRAFT_1069658 [Paraphysoderma sedebokerense]